MTREEARKKCEWLFTTMALEGKTLSKEAEERLIDYYLKLQNDPVSYNG